MNVLGISCHYHDAAACLVQDGAVRAAAQEERFNRRKSSPDFPVQAINYCVQEAGITINDVDHVAFYEKPFLKLERVIISHLRSWPRSRETFLRTLPPWLQDRLIVPLTLRGDLGYEGKVHFLTHHISHAGSSFLASPFEEAAILTADGVGEWTSTTLGRGEGHEIQLMKELRYPDSMGLLYTAVTTYLGFEALTGEGKVMALAEFGEPTYLDAFKKIVDVRDDGSFRIDTRFIGVHEGSRMYTPEFISLFGEARAPGAEIEKRHQEVAASLQQLLEEVLLKMACNAHELTGSRNLCLAGGVCLNISATSRIPVDTPFERIFIQPAAGDAGAALGAALYLYHALSGEKRRFHMTDAYLGPESKDTAIRMFLVTKNIPFQELSPEELVQLTAKRIKEGQIVGWFQGRLEFGPRALGHRSILADPTHPDMKDILNAKVKHREPFRPYGVSILREAAGDFFDFDRESPFMLQVARVKPEKRDQIPAALHINDTSRLQTLTREDNGIYYDLVKAFEKLCGVPMILNTSFNDRGEPIVCTPEDAYNCFAKTKMDCLVMGRFLVEKGLERNTEVATDE